MAEFTPDQIRDWQRMRDMRNAGYYESEGSETMPEFTGPSDIDREIADLKTKAIGMGLIGEHTTRQGERVINMGCFHCRRITLHRTVAVNDVGNPVRHCTVCCTCHLCYMSPDGQERLHQAVMETGSKLSPPPENPMYCEDCGAMLRCGVCMTSGPGGYCGTCGQREDVMGRCPDCWTGI